MRQLIVIVILALLGWQGYRHYQSHPAQFGATAEVPPALPAPATWHAAAEPVTEFKCDGRTHCSQLTSCEEATYFLATAPTSKWTALTTECPANSSGANG